MSFLRLVNHAQAQGASFRAKEKKSRKVTIEEPSKSGRTIRPPKPSRSSPLRGSAYTVHSTGSESQEDYRGGAAYYVGEDDSTELEYSHEYGSSTADPYGEGTQGSEYIGEQEGVGDPVLALGGRPRGHTPAPRLRHEDAHTRRARRGWVGRPPHAGGPQYKGPQAQHEHPHKRYALIFFKCYRKGHTSPQCLITIKDLQQVVLNYEALSPMERLGIASTNYLKAKAYVEAGGTPGGTPDVSSLATGDTQVVDAPEEVAAKPKN